MSYTHLYIEKDKTQPLFVLFHGTGGDENDLIPIATFIHPEANILSIRGNVEEDGMLRYFKRYSVGHPDLEDLEIRSNQLIEYITDFLTKNGYLQSLLYALGYSNGANIISAINQQVPHYFDKCILAHGTLYLDKELKDQNDVDIFISLGNNDRMIQPANTLKMAQAYKDKGAKVEVFTHDLGHRLDPSEITAMKAWIR